MSQVNQLLRAFRDDENGAAAVEYAILLTLLSLALLTAWNAIAANARDSFFKRKQRFGQRHTLKH